MTRFALLGLVVVSACASQPAKPKAMQPVQRTNLNQRVAPADGIYMPDLADRRVGFQPVIGSRRVTLTSSAPSSYVTVEYCIDGTGRVMSADVVGENAVLGEVARDTVSQWKFAPVFVDGQPVTACSYVSFKTADPQPVITVSSR